MPHLVAFRAEQVKYLENMQLCAGIFMADLLTIDEAAAYLRLSERKLYELVSTGGIPSTKVTGKWLFPKLALDRWLAAGWPPVRLALRRRRRSSAAAMIRCWNGRCAKAAHSSPSCRKAARPA